MNQDTAQKSQNDPKTTAFLEPERVIKNLDLKRGDHTADFGSGHGYYTIPLARAVGNDGKVYAIDIQKTALDLVRSKAKLEHLLNVEPIWADLDKPHGSHLKDGFIDFVLMANVLFQSENKLGLFQEAYRILKPEGRLAAIEWDESITPFGPPLNLRIKKEVTKNLAMRVGFEPDREFEAGSHHYGLLFIKR